MVGLNYRRSLRRHRSLHRRLDDPDNSFHRLGKLPPLPMEVFLEDFGGSNKRDEWGRSKLTHSDLAVGRAIVEWEELPDYSLDLTTHIAPERSTGAHHRSVVG